MTTPLCSIVQRFRKTFQSLLEELVSYSNNSNVFGLFLLLYYQYRRVPLPLCPVAT